MIISLTLSLLSLIFPKKSFLSLLFLKFELQFLLCCFFVFESFFRFLKFFFRLGGAFFKCFLNCFLVSFLETRLLLLMFYILLVQSFQVGLFSGKRSEKLASHTGGGLGCHAVKSTPSI